LYGKKLKDIILYGSWARGQGTKESDIDLVIVLGGKVIPGKEIDRIAEPIIQNKGDKAYIFIFRD
jgi:predicted nucleotidyltransferase